MKTTLSIDELLAKAEGKPKRKVRCENNVNVQKYIERVGWQTGTYAVPTHVIFWHYRTQYTQTDITAKANKTVFFRTFNKRFPTYRKNNQRYYLLNEGIIEVTDELVKFCKSYDKQHWQKKKREKKIQLSGPQGNDSNTP